MTGGTGNILKPTWRADRYRLMEATARLDPPASLAFAPKERGPVGRGPFCFSDEADVAYTGSSS
mgnify:CR=1 FL=1